MEHGNISSRHDDCQNITPVYDALVFIYIPTAERLDLLRTLDNRASRQNRLFRTPRHLVSASETSLVSSNLLTFFLQFGEENGVSSFATPPLLVFLPLFSLSSIIRLFYIINLSLSSKLLFFFYHNG